METALCIIMGLGLAAACGFRVFVPLLAINLAAVSGHLQLGAGFDWMGSYPALIVLASATALEIGGYYIPWVDNLLDTVATPAAIIAGTVAMAASVSDMSPLMTWSLGVIGGGSAAAAVQAVTVTARAASSAVTGGLGNPIVSTVEAVAAASVSILAILLPLAALVLVVIGVALLTRRLLTRRRAAAPAWNDGQAA